MEATSPTSRLDDYTNLHTVATSDGQHVQPSIAIDIDATTTTTNNGTQHNNLHPYIILDNENSSATTPAFSPDVVPTLANGHSAKSIAAWQERV